MRLVLLSMKNDAQRKYLWCREALCRSEVALGLKSDMSVYLDFLPRRRFVHAAGGTTQLAIVTGPPPKITINSGSWHNRRKIGIQHNFVHEIGHIVIRYGDPRWLEALALACPEASKKARTWLNRWAKGVYKSDQRPHELLCETFAEALYLPHAKR